MKYRIDDLDVDLHRRTVARDGATIALPDLSWRVFAALIEAAPKTLSLDDLASAAWRQDHVSPDTITQRMKLLRQALGDDPAAPRYIATERGAGYRLIAPVERAKLQAPQKTFPLRTLAASAILLTIAALSAYTFRPQPAAPATIALSATPTVSDLIARGYDYLRRGSYEDNEAALRLFKEAEDKAPENMAAIIGQSFAHSHRATKYDFENSEAVIAEKLARRALKTNPKEADPWHALGFALDAQAQVSEALRAYEQAIAINPEDVSARASAAYLLQIQGRLHEALLMDIEALNRGEPSLFSYIQIASALHLAGLDEAAGAWLKRAQTLTPDNLLLDDLQAELLLSKGLHEEASDLLAASVNEKRRTPLDVFHGEALLALGQKKEAKRLFEHAIESDKDNAEGAAELAAMTIMSSNAKQTPQEHPFVTSISEQRSAGDEWPHLSISAAYLFAAAGNSSGAAALLSEAHELGYRDTGRLRHSPFLKHVINHPDIQAVLEKMDHDAAVQRTLIINDDRLVSVVNTAH